MQATSTELLLERGYRTEETDTAHVRAVHQILGRGAMTRRAACRPKYARHRRPAQCKEELLVITVYCTYYRSVPLITDAYPFFYLFKAKSNDSN